MEPEELSEHVERDDAAFEEQTKMVRRLQWTYRVLVFTMRITPS